MIPELSAIILKESFLFVAFFMTISVLVTNVEKIGMATFQYFLILTFLISYLMLQYFLLGLFLPELEIWEDVRPYVDLGLEFVRISEPTPWYSKKAEIIIGLVARLAAGIATKDIQKRIAMLLFYSGITFLATVFHVSSIVTIFTVPCTRNSYGRCILAYFILPLFVAFLVPSYYPEQALDFINTAFPNIAQTDIGKSFLELFSGKHTFNST